MSSNKNIGQEIVNLTLDETKSLVKKDRRDNKGNSTLYKSHQRVPRRNHSSHKGYCR